MEETQYLSRKSIKKSVSRRSSPKKSSSKRSSPKKSGSKRSSPKKSGSKRSSPKSSPIVTGDIPTDILLLSNHNQQTVDEKMKSLIDEINRASEKSKKFDKIMKITNDVVKEENKAESDIGLGLYLFLKENYNNKQEMEKFLCVLGKSLGVQKAVIDKRDKNKNKWRLFIRSILDKLYKIKIKIPIKYVPYGMKSSMASMMMSTKFPVFKSHGNLTYCFAIEKIANLNIPFVSGTVSFVGIPLCIYYNGVFLYTLSDMVLNPLHDMTNGTVFETPKDTSEMVNYFVYTVLFQNKLKEGLTVALARDLDAQFNTTQFNATLQNVNTVINGTYNIAIQMVDLITTYGEQTVSVLNETQNVLNKINGTLENAKDFLNENKHAVKLIDAMQSKISGIKLFDDFYKNNNEFLLDAPSQSERNYLPSVGSVTGRSEFLQLGEDGKKKSKRR